MIVWLCGRQLDSQTGGKERARVRQNLPTLDNVDLVQRINSASLLLSKFQLDSVETAFNFRETR